MRTALLRTITIATSLAALAACGESSNPSGPTYGAPPSASAPSESTTEPEPEPAGTVVKISISGTTVSPSGKRIETPLDQPVILQIDSDRAGELHVHSTPEQVVVFKAGSTQDELVFEQPGVVDVEEHETGEVLVQLQVS